MYTRLSVITIAILWCALCLAAPHVYGDKMAYVTNNLSETLSRVNLKTLAVENDIVPLGRVPNQILLHNSLAYVVNSLSDEIQVIDLTGDSTITYISLLPSSNPWHMVLVEDTLAYVTNWKRNSVSKVNLLTGELLAEIPVGTSPEGICAAENLLYVANSGYSFPKGYEQGTISVIDTGEDAVIATIEVGTNPQDLAIDPQGEINVVCTGDFFETFGSVYVIDPTTLTVNDSIAVGGSPGSIAVFSTGMAYLGAGGWAEEGLIYQVNLLTNKILHGEESPIITDPGVMGVAVDDKGDLYSCNFSANTLVWLVPPDSTHARFNMSTGPNYVAIAEDHAVSIGLIPDGQEVVPGGELGYTLVIRNLEDRKLTANIVTGVTLSSGKPYKGNPIAGPKDLPLQPYQERTIHITHQVPHNTPRGRYVYFLRTTVSDANDRTIRSFWFDVIGE